MNEFRICFIFIERVLGTPTIKLLKKKQKKNYLNMILNDRRIEIVNNNKFVMWDSFKVTFESYACITEFLSS